MFANNAGKEIFIYAPKAIVYHPVEKSRTRKSYFYSFYFNNGRAIAITGGPIGNVVYLKGIPRYKVKILLNKMLSCVFTVNAKKRFGKAIEMYQLAGELYEYYNIHNRKISSNDIFISAN